MGLVFFIVKGTALLHVSGNWIPSVYARRQEWKLNTYKEFCHAYLEATAPQRNCPYLHAQRGSAHTLGTHSSLPYTSLRKVVTCVPAPLHTSRALLSLKWGEECKCWRYGCTSEHPQNMGSQAKRIRLKVTKKSLHIPLPQTKDTFIISVPAGRDASLFTKSNRREKSHGFYYLHNFCLYSNKGGGFDLWTSVL